MPPMLLNLLGILVLIASQLSCKPISKSRLTDLEVNGNERQMNRTGLGFVFFDDSDDFREDRKRIEELTSNAEKFGEDFKLGSIDLFTPGREVAFRNENINADRFEVILKRNFEKLKGKSGAELFIFISSHGGHGYVCRQCRPKVYHHELIDSVYRVAENLDPDRTVQINLVYSACHSFSMADAVHAAHQNYPARQVTLISSAAAEMFSHGSLTLDALATMMGIMRKADPDLLDAVCPGCNPFARLAKLMHGFGAQVQELSMKDWMRSYSTHYDMNSWSDDELATLERIAEDQGLNWQEVIDFRRRSNQESLDQLLVHLDSPIAFERNEAARKIMQEGPSKIPATVLERARRELIEGLYSENETLHLPSAVALNPERSKYSNVSKFISETQEKFIEEFDPRFTEAITNPNAEGNADIIFHFSTHIVPAVGHIAIDAIGMIKDSRAIETQASRLLENPNEVVSTKDRQILLETLVYNLIAHKSVTPKSLGIYLDYRLLNRNKDTTVTSQIDDLLMGLPSIPDSAIEKLVDLWNFHKAGEVVFKTDGNYRRIAKLAYRKIESPRTNASERYWLFTVLDRWQKNSFDEETAKVLENHTNSARDWLLEQIHGYPGINPDPFSHLNYLGDAPVSLLEDQEIRTALTAFLIRLNAHLKEDDLKMLKDKFPTQFQTYQRLMETMAGSTEQFNRQANGQCNRVIDILEAR